MNKNTWYWVGGIILIILLIVFFSFFFKSWETSVKTEEGKTTAVLEPCEDQLKTALAEVKDLEIKNQRLQAQLDSCCPKLKKLTAEEENELLKKEIAELKKGKKSAISPAPRKRKFIQEDVPEQDFDGGGFNRSSSDFQRQTSTGSQINSGVKMDFAGDIPRNSKFGITVTADRHPLYYVKDSYPRENGMSIPALVLNMVGGPEFTYDASSTYWYYVDYNILVTPSMLNNPNYTIIWCVYIGRIGTWDAFLPHESLKAEMRRVRGREDGIITMEELYRMHESNPDIWTDRNKTGTLMPKSFNPNTGEAEKGTKIGPEDGLTYQGWDFRTMITGTVTTDKVNGSSSYGN